MHPTIHPTGAAAELRRRAGHLRSLASAIEHLSVLALDGHAGDDTWRGRRPALCREVLSTNQHQLLLAADQLRTRAIDLERQADQLDAAAAAAVTAITASPSAGRVG